ncbi:relaxase/mobilization nuclease domain-containing protein [Nesterenkonia sp. E16_7]|uniref:relaxase/mobilization nuclease domain-containing protein n=1 Tax=unclassified Nesterenkonia TaxID=2629769 RepID=UPI001A90E286|nr:MULTISPECIES: relaxase/mobilization nuclease domain-containing protein [unclassified Nesterenkonia]MBO0596955.1 relaxase/mobilization nuclease domain-containing protein [Nesterenkonia sp. E16_10]MBO0598407.1 relaxase/mobilization nuclease domain-containing protein [Nesterenkonia sp. E16_7]
MMPNVTRGGRMAGLVMYLAGPGRANEHTNPQLIEGHDLVTFAVEPGRALSADDALDIANILDFSRKQHGTRVLVSEREFDEAQGEYVTTGKKDAHVWHASLSLKADEGELSAEKWAEVAHDFVEKMGFIDPEGVKTSRWAAIHHGASKNGNDHIHIAVQLVREDGTKADVRHDFKRAQRVSNEIEKKHGLTVLASREHEYGLSGDKPAELARAQDRDSGMTERTELRRRARTCLATASSQGEYIRHLHDLGVHVQPRFAKGDRNTIVGYRLAFPSASRDQGGDGRQIWYSPSKLDRSLAWPRIEERYGDAGRAAAVTLMHQIREKTVSQPVKATEVHRFSAESYEKLISGKVGPDTMANIYARLSMSMEKNSHGSLVRLSDDFSRVAWSMRGHHLPAEVLYRQRGGHHTGAQRASRHPGQGRSGGAGQLGQQWLMATQAGRRSPVKDWVSLLAQANRIARIVTETNLTRERAQLARNMNRSLDVAEVLCRERAPRTENTVTPQQRVEELRGLMKQRETQDYAEVQDAKVKSLESQAVVSKAHGELKAAQQTVVQAADRYEGLVSGVRKELGSEVVQDARRGREADLKVFDAGLLSRGRATQESDTIRRELASRWDVPVGERVKPQKQRSTNPFTSRTSEVDRLWSRWTDAVVEKHAPRRLDTPEIREAQAARDKAAEHRDQALAQVEEARQASRSADQYADMLRQRHMRTAPNTYLTGAEQSELARLERRRDPTQYRAPEEARGPSVSTGRYKDSGHER